MAAVRLLAFPLCVGGWGKVRKQTLSLYGWIDDGWDVDRRTIPSGVFLFPSLHIFMHPNGRERGITVHHIDVQAGMVVSLQRIILLEERKSGHQLQLPRITK